MSAFGGKADMVSASRCGAAIKAARADFALTPSAGWVGVKLETYIQCGRLPALLHFQLTRNPAIK
jgi:hypothetical protein